MAAKQKKIRNPIAKDLRSPKYRMRVVKNKKAYDRKSNSVKTLENPLEI
jgi:hypothetical protein